MKIFWGPIGGLSMNGGGIPLWRTKPAKQYLTVWQALSLSFCIMVPCFTVYLFCFFSVPCYLLLLLSCCLVVFFSCCSVVLLSSSFVALLSCCLVVLLLSSLVVLFWEKLKVTFQFSSLRGIFNGFEQDQWDSSSITTVKQVKLETSITRQHLKIYFKDWG